METSFFSCKYFFPKDFFLFFGFLVFSGFTNFYSFSGFYGSLKFFVHLFQVTSSGIQAFLFHKNPVTLIGFDLKFVRT